MFTYEKAPSPQHHAWISTGEDYEARHWSGKLESPPQQLKEVIKASGLSAQGMEDPIKSSD